MDIFSVYSVSLWCLSGWPDHRASAEKVQVDVIDALPRVFVHVEDGAPARAIDLLRTRELLRQGEHLPHERFVAVGKVVERGDVLPRDDEDMRGSLRIDVAEGDEVFRLGHDRRLRLARGDIAEDARRHGATIAPPGGHGNLRPPRPCTPVGRMGSAWENRIMRVLVLL